MTTKQEAWAEKVDKILRKAESTTPEEAEMLFAKAQELMAKYAIDEAMLRQAGHASDDGIVRVEFVITGIYRFPLSDLCFRVLKNNDCEVVQYGGKNPRYVGGKLFKETVVYCAVGFKSDIDNARLLYTSLELQAIRAESIWWKKTRDEPPYCWLKPKEQHYHRRQFLSSFGYGVDEKMKAGKGSAREQADAEHGSTGVALAIRSKEIVVKSEFDKMFPDLRAGRSKGMKGGSMSAHEAGKAAGRQADVGDPKLGNKRKALNG
jgi:hypothetical protein